MVVDVSTAAAVVAPVVSAAAVVVSAAAVVVEGGAPLPEDAPAQLANAKITAKASAETENNLFLRINISLYIYYIITRFG